MDKVTNRQLYEAIQSVESSVNAKIDMLVEKRILPLEKAMAKIYAYGGMAVLAIGIVVDIAVNWIKQKFI